MDTKTLTIRIDAEDYAALKMIAIREQRSLSWLCSVAIKAMLITRARSGKDKLTPKDRA